MKAIAHIPITFLPFLFLLVATSSVIEYSSVARNLSRSNDFEYGPRPNNRNVPRSYDQWDDESGLHNDTEIERTVLDFIHKLHSFVSDSALNIIGFKSQTEILLKTFERIDDSVVKLDMRRTLSRMKDREDREDREERRKPGDQSMSMSSHIEGDIFLLHKTASHMFYTMIQTVELLFMFKKRYSKASDLVCKVVLLNSRLLALIDDRGFPNRRIVQFEFKLTRLHWILGMWKRRFSDLHRVKQEERTVFDRQYGKAKRMLHYLADTAEDRRNNVSLFFKNETEAEMLWIV